MSSEYRVELLRWIDQDAPKIVKSLDCKFASEHEAFLAGNKAFEQYRDLLSAEAFRVVANDELAIEITRDEILSLTPSHAHSLTKSDAERTALK